jgi:predicted enzyme related to lactoylglutathione lyase
MSESHLTPDRPAAIVAPVSRHLSIANLDRSLAFYRDVLGFEVRPITQGDGVSAVAEAVRGPARIQFSTQAGAFDNTGAERPRGVAILFFQTEDIAAMRHAICACGGQPSELESVNWIKMRMFQIHDPDGHALWFGQSFHQPDRQATARMLKKIMPCLPLDDVNAGVAYYRDVLGFTINYAQHDLGVMDRDDVGVLLVARKERQRGIGSCYVYVRDADALYAELKGKGANVLDEPVSHPWGLRDFRVVDLEGNQITFGQPFE